MIQFDQYWNYVTNNGNLYSYSFNLKYVNGYFYISAKAYFHKTNKNFIRIASYFNYDHHPASSYYTSIYYDSSSSLFYVAGLQNQGVSIFDTNSNLQRYMAFGGFTPHTALRYFNGNLYASHGNFIIVASKSTGALIAKYNTFFLFGWYKINKY